MVNQMNLKTRPSKVHGVSQTSKSIQFVGAHPAFISCGHIHPEKCWEMGEASSFSSDGIFSEKMTVAVHCETSAPPSNLDLGAACLSSSERRGYAGGPSWSESGRRVAWVDRSDVGLTQSEIPNCGAAAQRYPPELSCASRGPDNGVSITRRRQGQLDLQQRQSLDHGFATRKSTFQNSKVAVNDPQLQASKDMQREVEDLQCLGCFQKWDEATRKNTEDFCNATIVSLKMVFACSNCSRLKTELWAQRQGQQTWQVDPIESSYSRTTSGSPPLSHNLTWVDA